MVQGGNRRGCSNRPDDRSRSFRAVSLLSLRVRINPVGWALPTSMPGDPVGNAHPTTGLRQRGRPRTEAIPCGW